MAPLKIRVATRRSNLSIKQVELVVEALKKFSPGMKVKVKFIKTKGDIHKDLLPTEIGSKGIFEKEVNLAVLKGEADIAVHSLKDIPLETSRELTLAAVLPRESPFEALVSRKGLKLEKLPAGSVIGTSSARRKSALLYLRPDVKVSPLRGNVETRLAKLHGDMYDAVLVAEAGLKRLGLSHEITQVFPPEKITPAPCQGVIGVYTRGNDEKLLRTLSKINDKNTYVEALIERGILKKVGGGCFTPLGIYAKKRGTTVEVISTLYSPNGKIKVSVKRKGETAKIKSLINIISSQLLSKGAEILASIKSGRI